MFYLLMETLKTLFKPSFILLLINKVHNHLLTISSNLKNKQLKKSYSFSIMFSRIIVYNTLSTTIGKKEWFWSVLRFLVSGENSPTYKDDGKSPSCTDCNKEDHTTVHIFNCPTKPTILTPINLWMKPRKCAEFLNIINEWP